MLQAYMMEMWKAIYIDRVRVDHYMIWSLLDDFEWTSGYRYVQIYRVSFIAARSTKTLSHGKPTYAAISRESSSTVVSDKRYLLY